MFFFLHNLEIRFRDIDALGHVNNAVYLSYLEQTRAKYLETLGLRDSHPTTILVGNEIDYLRPVLLHDSLIVKMRCLSIGRKSLKFEYHVFANAELAARAISTHVWFDFAAGQSVLVPPEAILKLEQLEQKKLVASKYLTLSF
jgi:acyl-CoA thioester hydrolase